MMDSESLISCLLPWRWDRHPRRAFVMLASVVTIGTAGIHWIEGWDVWRSFFFTLITLTTVGYTEYDISPAGERFTALILIGGIAIASYCLAQIVEFVANQSAFPERKIMHQIQHLSGHHIVCGAGSMGSRVIERLEAQGEVVVAIDIDEGIVQKHRDRGLIVLHGDATSDVMLHQAGVERAQSLAAATASDAVNAMVCLSAHALAPDMTLIARAHAIESETKLRRAGAQTVISPTIYGGDGIAEFMARPDTARVMFGDDGTDTSISNPMRIFEFDIDAGTQDEFVSVADFESRHPTLTVVAYRPQHGPFEMKPDARRELHPGDSLMVAGLVADLGTLRVENAA
tara:strand:+ start:370 stop:1401 length:1032 start_codon:yes stop_codon:yes gene_type:complete